MFNRFLTEQQKRDKKAKEKRLQILREIEDEYRPVTTPVNSTTSATTTPINSAKSAKSVTTLSKAKNYVTSVFQRTPTQPKTKTRNNYFNTIDSKMPRLLSMATNNTLEKTITNLNNEMKKGGISKSAKNYIQSKKSIISKEITERSNKKRKK